MKRVSGNTIERFRETTIRISGLFHKSPYERFSRYEFVEPVTM